MNAKLHPLSFALACGLLWSIGMGMIALLSYFFGYGLLFLTIWMNVYLGFDLSLLGILIGVLYAFVDAFIGGFVLALLYNFFLVKSTHEE